MSAKRRIIVIDGGFSTQLKHYDHNDFVARDPLWTTRYLQKWPDIVVRTHLAFLEGTRLVRKSSLETVASHHAHAYMKSTATPKILRMRLMVSDCFQLLYQQACNRALNHNDLLLNAHNIAGAEIITTNTYQASIPGFKKYLKLSEEESYNLIVNAVKYAKEARVKYIMKRLDADAPHPRIAGSVGPYGAFLHDLSEYTGAYMKTTTKEELIAFHKPRIEALIEGGVDLLAFETIPSRLEAETLIQLLKEYPKMKAWLSFSCHKNGKTTAYGDDFKEAVIKCHDLNPEQLVAVGANCFSPTLVASLFSDINSERTDDPVPLIAYPNRCDECQTGTMEEKDVTPFASYVEDWIKLGICYIGGCCMIDAAEIRQIKDKVRELS